MKKQHIIYLSIFLILVFMGIGLEVIFFGSSEVIGFISSESGPYEKMSSLLWLILLILCLFTRKIEAKTKFFAIYGAGFGFIREMDLHKKIFEMSFLKINFYKSSEIAISHKLIGGCLFFLLVITVLYLANRCYQTYRNAASPKQLSYFYCFSASICLVGSKFLDRINNQLIHHFNYHLSSRTASIIVMLEESAEMLVPLLFIVALVCYQKQRLRFI